MPNYLIFCVVTVFVTYANRLYIPIICLLVSKSILLSIYLSISQSVYIYVGYAICVPFYVADYIPDYLFSCVSIGIGISISPCVMFFCTSLVEVTEYCY